MKLWISLLLLCSLMPAGCRSERRAPAPEPGKETVLQDAKGNAVAPLTKDAGRLGTVLIFAAIECPISNAYSPRINELCEAYENKGFAFFIVHSDPDVTAQAASKHAAEFGYRCRVLLDADQQLARRIGATKTPEVAVVTIDGNVAYLGRIDDWYTGLAKQRFAPTTRDLADALDAIAAGRTVETARTEVVGCSIWFRDEKAG